MLLLCALYAAFGVIVCTEKCPDGLECLSRRCLSKCTTTADCEKRWGKPANTFICSTYCFSKCLFDIDCDMSNGETCMGNTCRIECSEDSDCRWNQVQEKKQCSIESKECFWPCEGDSKDGNACASDGLFRGPCASCQQPMMCRRNFCFDTCSDTRPCKELEITVATGGNSVTKKIKQICLSGACQQYCIGDLDCPGRKLCSAVGICAYRCNDVTCDNVTKCAPDGGCRDLPDEYTGECAGDNKVAIDGYCYDQIGAPGTRSSCPSGQKNFKGVCKYMCTANTDCDKNYLCQELTGVCTKSEYYSDLTVLSNCWEHNSVLNVEYQSAQACITLVPTNSTMCALNLPAALALELNLSTYKEPIKSILYDYNYTTTTKICIKCPASNVVNCRISLRASEAATMALVTPTHMAMLKIGTMSTLTMDFDDCFDEAKSTLRLANPTYISSGVSSSMDYAVCASLLPRHSCSFLADYPIHKIELTVISRNKTENIALDASFFDPSSGIYCYTFGDANNTTAKEIVVSYLSDPWTRGNFTLVSIVDGVEVTIDVGLNFMSTAFLGSCFAKMHVYLNPDMVFVDMTPNVAEIDAKKCELPAGTNFVNVIMLLLHIETNEQLMLNYNLSQFSFANTTRLFFYPEGSYNNFNGIVDTSVSATSTTKKPTPSMRKLREFYNALAANTSVIRGSLLMNFWRTGEVSQSGTAWYAPDSIEASCFNYTSVAIENTRLCVSLTSSVSPTCSVEHLPSAEDMAASPNRSYDPYVKNLTLEVFDASNISIRIGMLQAFSQFSLNTTEYCFSCSDYVPGSSTDPKLDVTKSPTALCTSMLQNAWKTRGQQIIGFRVQGNRTSDASASGMENTASAASDGAGTLLSQTNLAYRSSFITMTSIQSTNYRVVYIVTFVCGGCLMLMSVIYGTLLLRKVRAEMVVFMKLRKKKLRQTAKATGCSSRSNGVR